jgi:hypothetical protein
MSAFSFLFAACFVVSAALCLALMLAAWEIKPPALKRSGETTLGRNSVHWLAALALLSALLICSLAA